MVIQTSLEDVGEGDSTSMRLNSSLNEEDRRRFVGEDVGEVDMFLIQPL
jgi:hypothetical protein